MGKYSFTTTWEIETPIEKVWQAVSDMEKWPTWWKSVKSVTKLKPGDANGIGSGWRFVYTSRLPYNLEFESQLTRVEPPFVLEGTSAGELEGIGRWELSQAGSVTTARYLWNVETTKAWMNLLEPIMRPLFTWNHNTVMEQCAADMAAHLGARLLGPASHHTA